MYPVTQDFLDKMKADRRQVLARVAIDYTDPFIDQSIRIEASEQANVSYPQQTADSVDQTTRKYACLDGTWDLTSGEYHLAPSADQLAQRQFGWWGAQFCDQDGCFASPYPTLTVRHLPRPMWQLKVVGDMARGEYPVDFTVKLYGPDDTLLKTETVTGNDQVSWQKALEPQVPDVAKQELIITRWSLPGTCAKIVEFFTSIREVYETGDLVNLRLLEEREASQGSLPVGNISANEVTIALNNESKKFDLDNDNSPLKNLLKPNRRIQAWLGAEAENAAAENPPTFTRNSIAYLSDGTQVAANAPRFEQGKFGKAIMVEEGTTNLLTNPFFNSGLSGWSTQNATGDNKIYVTDGVVVIKAVDARPGLYQNVNLDVGTIITVSILIRRTYGSIAPRLRWGAGSVIREIEISENGQWVKCSATTDVSGNRNLIIEPSVAGQAEYEVKAVQVEQKPYATSFINGTRSPETLTIPTAGVLNPQEGTVECWINLHAWVNGISDNGVWSLTGSTRLDMWFSKANSNCLGVYDGTAWLNSGVASSSFVDSWHYIAYTWGTYGQKIYVDGVLKASTTRLVSSAHIGSLLYIGSYRGSYQTNSLIDDLRISSRARSDAEILAAYQSGQPAQRDEYTTYLLSFNGSIYPVEMCWVPLGTFWSLDWDSPDDSLEATIVARDRMELLRKSTFQTSQVLQNKSLYELAEIVLQDAGLTSDQYIIDPALQSIIIPYAWLNPVTHREALRQIAEAGLAAAFQNRDGKIQIESFLISGDEPVLEITEDDYFPPLRAPSRQDQVANEIIVDTQPLRPVATPEEVYRSNEPITIPGNTTKTITAFYNQPPVIDAVASLDNPPAGVSIVDATYYGWGASIKIQNTNATDKQATLVIQGKLLTVQNKERAIARDETSITENGVLRYEFPENPLVQTLAQAQAIANTLLASVKDPRRDIEVDWRGNPALLLGDRVTVKGKDYHVIRQEISWAGYMQAKLTGRKAE